MRDLEGVYVANVTPFGEDGSLRLDRDAYVAHAAWLAEKGVRGVVPFGTNGEGPSVSLAEKLDVLAALFGEDLPLQVIPAVMQTSLPEALRLLEAINDLPAAAVLVLPPYYFKPPERDGLRRFFEAAVEATEHRVLLYHIPKYGVPVPEDLVAELPVWGVKDSSGDVSYTEKILSAGRGVLLGTEEGLPEKLATGAQGVVSALANFAPEMVIETYEATRSGDEDSANSLAVRLQRVRAATKRHSSPSVLKRLAQERHGTRMGTARPPFVPLPADYDPGSILDLALSNA